MYICVCVCLDIEYFMWHIGCSGWGFFHIYTTYISNDNGKWHCVPQALYALFFVLLSTAKRLITCQNAKCIEQDRNHNTLPRPVTPRISHFPFSTSSSIQALPEPLRHHQRCFIDKAALQLQISYYE